MEIGHKHRIWGCGLDSSSSRYDSLADSYKYFNVPLLPISVLELFLSVLLKSDRGPCFNSE
jgi:hypothetical protein